MGSSFFGRLNMAGSSSPSSSSTSSRKGKKGNSEKPKQPQRGLGVAQLEKIRLHGENNFQYPSLPYPAPFNQEDMRMQVGYSSSPSFSYSSSSSSYHPNMMMGLSEYERANMRYGDSHPTSTSSLNPGYGILESQHFAQPGMTRHFLHFEDSNHWSQSMGPSSHESESSDVQELDLELRLSL